MIQDFGPVMTAVYSVEGGFSNDPMDPGGMTDLGVTARQWAQWKQIPLSQVTAAMMQALTRADTDPFYRARYWNIIDGDALPAGLDAMIMHFEVNAGGIAARELQAIIGVGQDGVIGPKTLAALQTYLGYAGMETLLGAVGNAQVAYYESLPGFPHDGNGWLRRVNAMLELAYQLAGLGTPPPVFTASV